MTSCAIVAISKNEARYLPEWVAYHLAIGVGQIIIYDNESADKSSEIISKIGSEFPVMLVNWPSIPRYSPQRSAYNDAIKSSVLTEFTFFIDVDEFIVPFGYQDINKFISAIPKDVGAVAINWRCFGSSGIIDPNYESIIKSFVFCSNINFPNNKHVKTVARTNLVSEPFIHHVSLKNGKYVSSDFCEIVFESEGKISQPIYSGIQINHYQTKTFVEFQERMARGNANFPKGHPTHDRDGTSSRFMELDQNDETNESVFLFVTRFEYYFEKIKSILSS